MAVIAAIRSGLDVILWTGAILIVLPLLRALHDRTLRLLSAVLMVYAISRLFSPHTGDPTGITSLVLNLLVLAAAYFEVWFFRTVVAGERDEPPPRMRGELLVAASVAALAVGAWLAAPPAIRPTLPEPRPGEPAAYVFVISLVGYFTVVSGRAAYWTIGLLRTHRRSSEVSRHARIASGGFWCGVCIMGCAEVLRCGADLAKLAQATIAFIDPRVLSSVVAVRPFTDFLLLVGHGGFYIGVLTPLLVDAGVALALLVAARRVHRALAPLARATRAAFPEVVLQSAGTGRFYRRQLEIRDAVVLLDGFYDADVARTARQHHGTEHDTPPVVAALLVDALAAHREGRTPRHGHPVPTSGALSAEDDVSWIVDVAREFRRRQEPDGPTAPRSIVEEASLPVDGHP